MQISPSLKKILLDPEVKQLINDGKFEEVYDKISSNIRRGEFTKILLKADIPFMDYMSKLPRWAFYDTRVKKITIPRNITSIGIGAFATKEDLNDLYYLGNMENWYSIDKGAGWALGLQSKALIHCTDGTTTVAETEKDRKIKRGSFTL